MTTNHSIRVLRDFQQPIQAHMSMLGIDLCGQFKASFEASNAEKGDDERLTMDEYLTTILASVLPRYFEDEKKAERVAAKKEGRGAAKPARGGRRLEPVPQAAE